VTVLVEEVFKIMVMLQAVLQIEEQVVEELDLELVELEDLEDAYYVTMDHNEDQAEL
jgi:hypothetical protein